MSLPSLLTIQLLERARDGDADSLGLLLQKYFRYLNHLSHGHIDNRIQMRVSASDIVQETLLEAHRDFKTFTGNSLEEFTGWLRRILFNNLATAIERHVLTGKRDVRKQHSLDANRPDANQSTAQLGQLLQGDVSSPSAPMQRDELLVRLTAAIDRLPKDDRQVIHMRHFEGLSFAEISTRLGFKQGAVRMRWVRAVERLRREMPNDE